MSFLQSEIQVDLLVDKNKFLHLVHWLLDEQLKQSAINSEHFTHFFSPFSNVTDKVSGSINI